MKKPMTPPLPNAKGSSAMKFSSPRSTSPGALKHIKKNPPNSPIATTGGVFSDGHMLELIRQSNSSQPQLLLWTGKAAKMMNAACIDGKTYVTAEIDPSILASMLLPTGRTNYVSTRKLFDSISGVLRDYACLDEVHARLATYFVFASHFADCLETAPSLLVRGSAQIQVARFFRTLRLFCRRPLLLAGLRSAAFDELPAGLRPTLLLYLNERAASAEEFLRSSHLGGFGILKNGKLQDLFCAHAVYLGPRSSFAWEEESLQIPITVRVESMHTWDDQKEHQLATEFQGKLLAYRLENYRNVRRSCFQVDNFAGPTRTIARILGACIVGDEELQRDLIDLLRPQDEMFRVGRATYPESIVLEALLIRCHEEGSERTYVGEITDLSNGILRGRGETMQLSAKEVGGLLRSLGVLSKRDAKGYSFLLSNETRRKIHQRALALDLPSIREAVADCQFCAEIQGGLATSGAACTL